MMYEHFNFEMKNIHNIQKYMNDILLHHLSYSNMHWKPVLYPLHIPTFCSSFVYVCSRGLQQQWHDASISEYVWGWFNFNIICDKAWRKTPLLCSDWLKMRVPILEFSSMYSCYVLFSVYCMSTRILLLLILWWFFFLE